MHGVVVLQHRAALAGDVADGVVDVADGVVEVAVGTGTVVLALVTTERAAAGFEPAEIVVGENGAGEKETLRCFS